MALFIFQKVCFQKKLLIPNVSLQVLQKNGELNATLLHGEVDPTVKIIILPTQTPCPNPKTRKRAKAEAHRFCESPSTFYNVHATASITCKLRRVII